MSMNCNAFGLLLSFEIAPLKIWEKIFYVIDEHMIHLLSQSIFFNEMHAFMIRIWSMKMDSKIHVFSIK